MKPLTIAFAFFSVVISWSSCTSNPAESKEAVESPVSAKRFVFEGGSHHDTLEVRSSAVERIIVVESLNAEGGSSHDTVWVAAKRTVKIYSDTDKRKKP